MRFGVLGPLTVWTDGGAQVPIPGQKCRALLADLLVERGRLVSTDRLIDDLWGESPPANPAGALQVRVSQLRRALSDAEPGGRDLVVSRAPGYLLAVDPDAVDADRFVALAERAARTAAAQDRAALLGDALALWRGDAYVDFADERFARGAVVRLTEQRLAVLEQHAEARLELGEHSLLAGELGDLVARHPLRERLRSAHLRALYRAGRQSEALDGYADLRTRLAEELGLDPSPELVELHRAILGQDPALTAPTASARPTPSPPTTGPVGSGPVEPGPAGPVAGWPVPGPTVPRPASNLPAPLTELIGRESASGELRALLAGVRLVTLTGSGGVGKTRLAVETARGLVADLPDGAWLVELAALDRDATTDTVAERVLAALDVRDVTGEAVPPPDRLAGVLRARQLLLVLDNCEHVVERTAELVEALLRAAPGLRVLATSREPLGLPGERAWEVPPLSPPDPGSEGDPDGLARSAAVQLFVARASAASRDFTLDAGTAAAVAQLCRRLDGIPLALELAATRVRALGVTELVARLDDRFRVLTSGHRGAPARQQTLAAVIDWSWQLLDEPDQAVLRRLAGHSGGCTLAAAEAVCAGGGVPAEAVLDVLVRLVDRSLVVVDERPGSPPRYRLLESVAAYCADRLGEAGELASVRERHGGYYLDLAERAEPELSGFDQRAWLHRLDAEAANLRRAFDGAVRSGAADQALRLATALAWYRFLRGRLTEALADLRAALAVAGVASPDRRARAAAWEVGFALLQGEVAGWATRRDAVLRAYDEVDDPGARARAEWFLGLTGIGVGDLAASGELVDRALATFQAVGDRWGEAAALSARAMLAHIHGDLAELDRAGTECGRLFAELGDRWGMLQASDWLGGLAELTGKFDRASQLHSAGLRLAEELELWPDVAGKLSWLGWIAMQVGDQVQAREFCAEALRLSIEQDNRPRQLSAELGLGFAARRDGKLDVAETHLRNLLAGFPLDEPLAGGSGVAADPGAVAAVPLYVPMVLVELGFIAEHRGDPAAARDLHLRAFVLARRLDAPRDTAGAIEGLAGASALAGRYPLAAALLGCADATRRGAALPLAPTERAEVDRIADRTRADLGAEVFAAEFARGAGLSPEAARALVDRADDRHPQAPQPA